MFPTSKVVMYDNVNKQQYFKDIKDILKGDFVVSKTDVVSKVLDCGINTAACKEAVIITKNSAEHGSMPHEDVYTNKYQQVSLVYGRVILYAFNIENSRETQAVVPFYYMVLDKPTNCFTVSGLDFLPLTYRPDTLISNSLCQIDTLDECVPTSNSVQLFDTNSKFATHSVQDTLDEFSIPKQKEVIPKKRRGKGN